MFYSPFSAGGQSSLRLLSIRVAVGDPLTEGGPFAGVPAFLLLPVFVIQAEPLLIPELIPDTFPPVHLLQPLPQVRVVRVDVVMGLCLVVSSEKHKFYTSYQEL